VPVAAADPVAPSRSQDALRDGAPGRQPSGRRTTAGREATARPAWSGLVTLTAAALSVPLVLVDPVLAATLGIVCVVVGVLGARTSTGTERRHHLAGAALGTVTEVLLVLALTLLGSSLGAAAPWPATITAP
jgi:hypothetical protein